jgi:biotin carboxylase
MGGNAETVPLVLKAKELGYHVILSDDNPNSVSKQYADEAYNINGLDVEGIVSLSKEKNVNGILVGVADILVDAYGNVCEKLGFPCYTNSNISKIFSRKDLFKEKLKEFGLNGVPELFIDANNSFSDEELFQIGFPLMVKPVDNGGGVGMSAVQTKEELNRAIKFGLSNSRNKKVIIEKYMDCDDVGIYFTFQDGFYSTSFVYDRYTTKEQFGKSKVCLGGVYPSRFINNYFNSEDAKLKLLFRDLGIENGVLMLSAFFENNRFYYYDVGFRLQGEAPNILLHNIYGYDQKEMLIKFAMTGSMGDTKVYELDDPYLIGKHAATVWILLKKGVISKIDGLEDVLSKEFVVSNVQRLFIGDFVNEKMVGTEKQVFSRFYLVTNTQDELKSAIKHVQNSIKIYDENNNQMVLKGFTF